MEIEFEGALSGHSLTEYDILTSFDILSDQYFFDAVANALFKADAFIDNMISLEN